METNTASLLVFFLISSMVRICLYIALEIKRFLGIVCKLVIICDARLVYVKFPMLLLSCNQAEWWRDKFSIKMQLTDWCFEAGHTGLMGETYIRLYPLSKLVHVLNALVLSKPKTLLKCMRWSRKVCQRGPNLDVFFFCFVFYLADKGREDPNITIRGTLSARQRNAI